MLALSAPAQDGVFDSVPPAAEDGTGTSFFIPCRSVDEKGFLARYDALSGYLAGGVDVPGFPGKILFNRDGSRGFVLLDSDEIGVFDALESRWLYRFRTGVGLLDIALTPNGSKLIALCSERGPDDDGLQEKGALWICNVAGIDSFESGLEIERRPVAVDFVRSAGTERRLAVCENSRLLFIRTNGPYLTIYNLNSGAVIPVKLGNRYCSPCTVMDIQVLGTCLTALLIKPDGFGYLCIFNTQTRTKEYIPLGWEPKIFNLFKKDGRPMAVILHSSETGSAHFLRLFDLYSATVAKTIANNLLQGVRDVDINGSRDVGAVLYVRGGEGARYGLVGFFDKENLEWRREVVKVPVDSDTRLFLASSPLINRCYVLTGSGDLIPIDLNLYRKVGERIELDAEVVDSPSELF